VSQSHDRPAGWHAPDTRPVKCRLR
jgi:hypothetical protein